MSALQTPTTHRQASTTSCQAPPKLPYVASLATEEEMIAFLLNKKNNGPAILRRLQAANNAAGIKNQDAYTEMKKTFDEEAVAMGYIHTQRVLFNNALDSVINQKEAEMVLKSKIAADRKAHKAEMTRLSSMLNATDLIDLTCSEQPQLEPCYVEEIDSDEEMEDLVISLNKHFIA